MKHYADTSTAMSRDAATPTPPSLIMRIGFDASLLYSAAVVIIYDIAVAR